MRKLRAWAARLLVVAVAAGIGATAQATPASAGNCTGPLCGTVYNDLVGVLASVMTANYWCDPNQPRYGNPTAYTVPGCSGGTERYVDPGHNSDEFFVDTDAFRVPAGCAIKLDVGYTGGFGEYFQSGPYVEDRRGVSRDKWIKISDNNNIHITGYTCSSSMAKRYVQTWNTANGVQDQWCGYGAGVGTSRCSYDGQLWANWNYFFCRMWGASYGGNHWWLLTDLDTVNSGRDGRSFVSAYYLSGGPNNNAGDQAWYFDSPTGTWKTIPDC